MEYILSNEIKSMIQNLIELYEISYNQIKPKVAYIINNEIKDIDFICHILDELLDIPTDKCYNLFKELCNYTSQINAKITNEYLEIYQELYGEDELENKKKTISKK